MAIRTGLCNHVELVFRPGEAPLATRLLDLLGRPLIASKQEFAGVRFHSADQQKLFASEVTSEQWAFEQWLAGALEKDDSEAASAYVHKLGVVPQRYAHFGLGTDTLEEWEAVVERLQHAAGHDPELQGRIELTSVFRPGDPGSVARETGGVLGRTLYQAFLRTDILSAGLLTLGQTIEIQHYLENDPTYRAA